jgi:hypothetical protein
MTTTKCVTLPVELEKRKIELILNDKSIENKDKWQKKST